MVEIKSLLAEATVVVFDGGASDKSSQVHNVFIQSDVLMVDRKDLPKTNHCSFKNIIFFGITPNTLSDVEYINRLRPQMVYWYDEVTYQLNPIAYAQYSGDIGVVKLPFSMMMQNIERRFLFELAKRTSSHAAIFEIGRNSGGSTLALVLGNEVKHNPSVLVSLDILHNPLFDYYAKKYEVIKKIKCFVQDSKTFDWKNESENLPIGLLWIDGEHTYRGCKSDIERYKGFLSEGGVIAVHDYGSGNPEIAGIMKAVHESIVQDDQFENFCVVGSIFFAQKKGGKPMLHTKNLFLESSIPYYILEYLKHHTPVFRFKLAIYGTGFQSSDIFCMAQQYGLEQNIVAFIDDFPSQKTFYGLPVISLKETRNTAIEHILIASKDYEETMAQKLKDTSWQEQEFTRIYTDEVFNDFIASGKKIYRFVLENWDEFFVPHRNFGE